jgi:predicted MPP superfamily phosphohydrolase
VDDADGLPLLADTLRRLPHPEAAFAVLGNHDYDRHGREHRGEHGHDVSAVLAEAGIQVLSNSAHSALGAGLFIAGVDDPSRRRDDLDRAMAGVPEGACCLLLAHSPDVVLRLGQHRPGLVLAGHTHGGQIRLPLAGPLITMSRLPRRQVMGLHEHQGVPTFVSRGIGYSGVNLRLWCPPEVALLTLRSPLAAERAA